MEPEAPTRRSAAVGRLLPLVAMRDEVKQRHGSDAAYITLSMELVCVMEREDGSALTHQTLGEMGFSTHHAWNLSAHHLLRTQPYDDVVEFRVRNASFVFGDDCPRGYQVQAPAGTAASWLGHPRAFQMLERHFHSVLTPLRNLYYVTRDFRELFVFDAPFDEVAEIANGAPVLSYSLGFPLLITPQPTPASKEARVTVPPRRKASAPVGAPSGS